MGWVIFLTILLGKLVELAPELALGAAGSLTASGLQKLIGAARGKGAALTAEDIDDALRRHMPRLADKLDTNWVRIFDLRFDVEEVFDRIHIGCRVHAPHLTRAETADCVARLDNIVALQRHRTGRTERQGVPRHAQEER